MCILCYQLKCNLKFKFRVTSGVYDILFIIIVVNQAAYHSVASGESGCDDTSRVLNLVCDSSNGIKTPAPCILMYAVNSDVTFRYSRTLCFLLIGLTLTCISKIRLDPGLT